MNKIINNILESFDIILNENKSSLNEVSSTSSSLFGGYNPCEDVYYDNWEWAKN